MDIDSTLNWAWIFPCAEELVCCLDYHPVMLWSNDHNLIDQAKKKIEARADLLGYYKKPFLSAQTLLDREICPIWKLSLTQQDA